MQKIQYLWIFSKVRLSKVMKVMGPTVSSPDCQINFSFLHRPTWSWHIAASFKTHGSSRVCYCQNSRPKLFVGFLCLVKTVKFKPRLLSFWIFWCLFLESKFIPKTISCTTLYALHVWLFSVDHPWRCDPCFDGPHPSVLQTTLLKLAWNQIDMRSAVPEQQLPTRQPWEEYVHPKVRIISSIVGVQKSTNQFETTHPGPAFLNEQTFRKNENSN